ncbi:hypothetical protein AQPE_2703 [Aquipluma nitroreducens]|uniref:Uncharacterized protein n=1 Tax=Aquipluma nitroreducens TaxID=2010828 RepID=A0A5K7SAD5_9BACT|nr:hypothetical protein AQPE_2703 [Aquipluma nitroreducens]
MVLVRPRYSLNLLGAKDTDYSFRKIQDSIVRDHSKSK